MSRNFYFYKWKEVLNRLRKLVEIDTEFQVTQTHDKTLSEAVYRMTGILGQYMLMYNGVMECIQQNLQVQKTVYMDNIVKCIVTRILEMKRQLEELEGSNIQFIGYGVVEVHHTIMDIEMTTIPVKFKRPVHIQAIYDKILAAVKEKMAAIEAIANEPEDNEEEEEKPRTRWWEYNEHLFDEEEAENVKEILPEELRLTREYLALILAHEKTRQVISVMKARKLRRDMWEKELKGLLNPPAKYEVRQKGAEIIQKVFRTYFRIKRERNEIRKRDELLGLKVCETLKNDEIKSAQEMLQNRSKLYDAYEKEWQERREDLKENYVKLKGAQFCEETRDQIREWFVEWFDSVKFFHDLPKDGCVPIFKGLIPDPHEWLQENNALTIQKEANKKRSPQDLKFEKQEAKRQARLLKKEEEKKIRMEALLLKKMMKNPKMHPGYKYPPSKKTKELFEVIDQYHRFWDPYDKQETLDVKEKFIHQVDVEDVIMEARLETFPEADEQMKIELSTLKQALKKDYMTNGEEMPVDLTKPLKREKRKKKVKTTISEHLADKIQYLAENGFILDYPKTQLRDFIGGANYGGEDLRSQLRPALPFNYEIRALWWERCREAGLGFRKILLVGPLCSGKSTLVYALASVNDAVLFELDPVKVYGTGLLAAPYLTLIVNNVISSAKALQPSVIHIRHVQKLFYSKTPPEEKEMNLSLIKMYFINKLMKKINKTDRITIIATCTDPWLTKSGEILKHFPFTILLPNTNYSLVVRLLNEWVRKYTVISPDFNVSSLAQVLQGYSFGYIKDVLDKFMSAERIVKIAAFGLDPMEVYDYILDDATETKVDYEKYLNWYAEKTPWGKKETQHLKDQLEFQAAVQKYAAKEKKKARAKSAPGSTVGSIPGN